MSSLRSLLLLTLLTSPALGQDCPLGDPKEALARVAAAARAVPFSITVKGPALEAAIKVLRARVKGAGGELTEARVEGDALHLRGRVEGGQAAMAQLLHPGRLGLYAVAEAQMSELTSAWGKPPAGISVRPGYGGVQVESADEATLRAFVSKTTPAGHRWATGPIDNRGGEGPRYMALLLQEAGAVKDDHLDRCSTRTQEGQLGAPVVMMSFDDRGAEGFEALSRAQLKKRVAIVVDGVIQSAPVVQEPIPGGRVMISPGGFKDKATSARESKALVGVLRHGPLSGPLILTGSGN